MDNRPWRLIAGLAALLLTASACGTAAATPDGVLNESPAATSSALPGTTSEPTAQISSGASSAPSTPAGSVLPKGAVTIATFGDSLTQGDCDESGRGYPGRLLPLVEKVRPGSRVVNVGHSGWTSGDLANTADDPASEISRAIDAGPDVALVWIGSNDLWALYEFGPEPMTAEAERTDLESYSANLDAVLKRLSDKGVAIYVALLDDQSKRPVAANPPNPAEPAFPATTKADLGRMSGHIAAYNQVIQSKAGSTARPPSISSTRRSSLPRRRCVATAITRTRVATTPSPPSGTPR